jgi:hypothetical protein
MVTETSKLRICVALSTTQLLPLIHILRNESRDGFQDVLLWSSYESAIENHRMMADLIKTSEFHSAYELVDLKIPEPRRTGSILWPFQSLLRHRYDARKLRALLAPHLATAKTVEIWTDEPIHYPMRFLHGLFPNAIHVKFPHSFNQDDRGSVGYRNRMIDKFRKESTWTRRVFWRAIRLCSGVQYGLNIGIQFDRAYSFDRPSPWSKNTVDVSHLIKSATMNATYARLPLRLRREVEEKIYQASPIPGCPWTLLLLFGLDENLRKKYRDAIVRIHRERPEALSGFQLVVKPHPANRNDQPEVLAKELSERLNTPVTLFDCTLNLDILWSIVPAKFVLAGPCGALPTIGRLGAARAVILREILEDLITRFPQEKDGYESLVEGYDVW